MAPDQQRIRKNGIFYTPDGVAHFLAAELCRGLRCQNPKLLDPACGAGVLLEASRAACDSLLPSGVSRGASFLGRDLFEPSSWPRDPRVRFQKGDFFRLPRSSRFDAIIMNPPYVQYGSIGGEQRRRLHGQFAEGLKLSRMLDLWAYFLLKSLRHLKLEGRVAAIVPWSLLEAQYSSGLRHILAESFRSIRVLVLRDRHFGATEKRVLLLWLKGFGHRVEQVELGFSGTLEERHSFRSATPEEWETPGALACCGLRTRQVLESLERGGFCRLGDVAEIKIGVVTGANGFFIVAVDEAESMGFSRVSRTPIVTHVRELQGLRYADVPKNVLLRFGRLTAKTKARVEWGAARRIDELTHCCRRTAAGNPWYEVDLGVVPDAFFTYRVSRIPFLALNPGGYQCTNALHKVRFGASVSANARKWAQLSLLSDAGQLSLETGARHYRSGAIKVEPYVLKDALVYVPPEAVHAGTYTRASRAIADGDKERASQEATEAVRKVSGLKPAFWRELTETLREVRRRRNGTCAYPGSG